ncbi:MAG TPA: RNA polymerase sigma factor [Kofleriaceae bacterium]|nr:RNA polymerase sigma factor [Kofleriaceae bacterium]
MTAPAPRTDLDADRALAARAASGDRAAQREVFARTKNAVHAVLYRILGSNREMEDLAQDSFVSIFRSIHGFRGESSLTTWCCTIATRVAWAHLERGRPTTTNLELVPEVPDGAPDAARVIAARLATQRVYAALDKLDPRLRVTFALAVLDERPLAEVAGMTGASVVAVKTRLWRARRELAKRAAKDPALSDYLGNIDRGGAR